MKRRPGAALAVLLVACGGGGGTGVCFPGLLGSPGANCPSPVPPTCAEILGQAWAVNAVPELAVGDSRLVSVSSFAGSRPLTVCADRVRTIAWEAADSSVVSLLPEAEALPDRVWATGMSPGRTLVSARIGFADGSEKTAGPTEVRIVTPAGPPGARLIASARLDFAGPPCTAAWSSCAHKTFVLPTAGRVDVVVDWVSPLNRVAFQLLAGDCPGFSPCGQGVIDGSLPGVKPNRGSNASLPAGPYTLAISNGGPGPEVVRCEVWLTP
jgi:hypothetical protein